MTDDALLAVLVEIRAMREEIQALRFTVEQRYPPRRKDDALNAQLLHAIASALGDRVFSCAGLHEHAKLTEATHLRATLIAVTGESKLNPNKIGKRLSRIEGRSFDSLSVHRVGVQGHRASWMVKAVSGG